MKKIVLLNVPASGMIRKRFLESATCIVFLLGLAAIIAGCNQTITVNDENGDESPVSKVRFTPNLRLHIR